MSKRSAHRHSAANLFLLRFITFGLLALVINPVLSQASTIAGKLPNTIQYQGVLFNTDGSRYSATTDIQFSLYATASGNGAATWTE